MKILSVRMLVSTIVLGLALPAAAQTAPKPAQSAATDAAKHITTQDTTIGELLEAPAAKAILDKTFPG